MKIYFIIITICLIALFSCTEEEVTMYEGGTYIGFKDNMYKDSTNFSFFFHPNEEKMDIAIPVVLSGKIPEKDIELSITIDEENTTAFSENYELPEKPIFKAGQVIDSIYITVKNSEELKEKEYKIVLNIGENDNYKLGEEDHIKAKILINDMPSKPDWWDYTITKSYLGTYSNVKYQLFIVVTGISDLSDKEPSEIRALALKLKYYLQKLADEGKTVYDENNKLVKVPVIG